VYVNFVPAVGRDALRSMKQTIRGWHLQLRKDWELADLSARFDAVLRGWHGYYARFQASAMDAVWLHLNAYLVRWLRRKYKFLARHKWRAWQALAKLGHANRNAFVHWRLGCLPKVG
jgi:RNA-directed DNA polymerase